MRIGVRAHDYGKNSPKLLVSKLKEAGFEAAQLAIPKAIEGIDAFSQITEELLFSIKDNFKENNIDLAVLGCYIEPSLVDQDARREQLAIFLKALEYSKVVGAKMVGTETTHFTLEESERKRAFEALQDSVLRMAEKAEKVGAIVGIEPVSVHTLNTPELTYKLIQSVKSDKLKIIFDPVNLLTLTNIKMQNKLWSECFEAFGSSIEAVHAKDVVIEENHFKEVILGTGLVDYNFLFEWLNKHKSHVSILREGANPLTANQDIAFLKTKIG